MKEAIITTKDKVFKGILIQEKDDHYTLKLSSGYNIGIKKSNVKKLELGKEVKLKSSKKKVSKKSGLPKVTIISTGGTLASSVDYSTGAVSANFDESSILSLFPELASRVSLDVQVIANVMSEDFRWDTYNKIATAISKASDSEGFIVVQGTDTLHYTSSALSFMFPNPSKPILLVGSQRSSDRPSSDAAVNLLSAVSLITNSDFSGVGVVMHESMSDSSCLLFRGTNVRKMHSTRRDAFKAVNQEAYARIKNGKVEFLSSYTKRTGDPLVKPKKFKKEVKVGLLKTTPNLDPDILSVFKKYDGLVIESTGLGNVPISSYSENEAFAKSLASLSKKIPVAAALQTIFGRVCMNVYSNSRKLLDLGVLGNGLDMSPETAYIKLAYLLSNYSTEKVRELYQTNLVGEISEFSTSRGYL